MATNKVYTKERTEAIIKKRLSKQGLSKKQIADFLSQKEIDLQKLQKYIFECRCFNNMIEMGKFLAKYKISEDVTDFFDFAAYAWHQFRVKEKSKHTIMVCLPEKELYVLCILTPTKESKVVETINYIKTVLKEKGLTKTEIEECLSLPELDSNKLSEADELFIYNIGIFKNATEYAKIFFDKLTKLSCDDDDELENQAFEECFDMKKFGRKIIDSDLFLMEDEIRFELSSHKIISMFIDTLPYISVG